jgi:hypothetical protein
MKMKTRKNIEPVMNQIIDEYGKGIKAIRNYIESAKKQTIKLSDNDDERTLEEVAREKQTAKINQMKADIVSNVKNIITEYINSENDFFTLDGKAITDDVKLLSLPLNAEQVKELQSRYKNNFTMLQAVNDYAKKNNLPVYPLQSKESRIDTLNFWNDKCIYPRFNEHTDFQESKYDFLEQATAFKESYISKFEEVAE